MQPSSSWEGSTSALNASSAATSLPGPAVNDPMATTSDMRSSSGGTGRHPTHRLQRRRCACDRRSTRGLVEPEILEALVVAAVGPFAADTDHLHSVGAR